MNITWYKLNNTHYDSGTRGAAVWMVFAGLMLLAFTGPLWLLIGAATLLAFAGAFTVQFVFSQMFRPHKNLTPITPYAVLALYAVWVGWTAHRHPLQLEGMQTLVLQASAFGFAVGLLGTVVGVILALAKMPVFCPANSFQPIAWYEGGRTTFPAAPPAPTPVRVIMSPTPSEQGKDSAQTEETDADERRYPAEPPTKTFADLFGYDAFKALLREHLQQWRAGKGNGLLMYGPPGTGKTAFAQAIAGELKLPIITISFGDISSKWVNQSTEQLMQVLEDAQAQAPCVLFMDEIDSVLTARESAEWQPAEYARMTGAFLSRIERLRAAGGVFYIGATNRLDRIDPAAMRVGRFDWRAELPLPDEAARRGLILQPIVRARLLIADSVLSRFARRWVGMNVPQILNAAEEAARIALQEQRQTVTHDDLYRGLRRVQGPRAIAPEGSLPLEALILNPEARSSIDTLVAQMRNLDLIEAEGGSMIKGALFYGPPGTGKTTVAKAMALAVQWPLIVRMGRDLMNADAVAALRQEIQQLRPAIVFIDEADDILGHRAFAGAGIKAATNDLLALIDGAHSVPDVLWLAATNDPDSIDAAALRGGRFEMKVPFLALQDAALRQYLTDWLQRNPQARPTDPTAWIEQVMPHLAGLTPGNLEAILRSANNEAILAKKAGGSRAITPAQIDSAKQRILA